MHTIVVEERRDKQFCLLVRVLQGLIEGKGGHIGEGVLEVLLILQLDFEVQRVLHCGVRASLGGEKNMYCWS